SEAATIPFPRADTTPPVTKTYFGARALTGFQGSSPYGWCLFRGRPDELGEPGESLRGNAPPHAAEPRSLDAEHPLRLAVLHRRELEVHLRMLAAQLEDDALERDDLEEEQRPAQLRAAAEARTLRAFELPVRTRRERSAHARRRADEPGPPLGPARRVGEHRPDLLDRRRESPPSLVPWQGIPGRRASARAPLSARCLRAARFACGSARRGSSRPGSDGRRARRSAGGG